MRLMMKMFMLLLALVVVFPEFGVKAPMLVPLPVAKAPAPVKSTFLLAVHISSQTLHDRLEAAVPLVYTGVGHGTVGETITTSYDTKYEINREKINLSLGENTIGISTLLSGTGNAVVPAHALRPRISVTMDVAADIGITSIVQVKPEWFIKATTTTHLHVSKAATQILKVPVSAIDDVQEALRPKMDKLGERVTAALEKMDVRSPVEKAWQNLAKPIMVDKKNSGWLIIKPHALYYSGFTNTATGIVAVIGVDAMIDGVYGQRPKDINVGELPPFQAVSPEASGFNINLPVFASYQYLSEPLKKEMGGKVFKLGSGAQLAVKNAKLYGNGERVVVELDFLAKLPNQWLNTSGKIYFFGKPVFDSVNNRFSMQGFDYMLKTESFLLEAANAVFYESLRSKVAEKLSWDLTAKLQDAKLRANQNLANVVLKHGGRLKGSVSKVGVNGVYPLAEGIQIDAVMKGDVSVEY